MRGGPTRGANTLAMALMGRRRAADTARLAAMMTVCRGTQQQGTTIRALRAQRTERSRLRVQPLPATRVLCALTRKVARLIAASGGTSAGAIRRPGCILIVLSEPVGYIQAL